MFTGLGVLDALRKQTNGKTNIKKKLNTKKSTFVIFLLNFTNIREAKKYLPLFSIN